MKKEIKLGDKSLMFEATAMTDYMADHIFGINIAYSVQHAEKNAEKMPELVRKIAFIMNKRAELGGWKKVEDLSQEDYYDWLDGIDSYEIEQNAAEIMNLYAKNKETKVLPKKENSPQPES